MNQPYLANIRVYPIKSLDPVEVDSIGILESGRLESDRSFALFDDSGNLIKTKSATVFKDLRAKFDLEALTVCLGSLGGEEATFELGKSDRSALNDWLSTALGRRVELRRDEAVGFADDLIAAGPTVISTATIEEIASWFEGVDTEEIRRRLRSNLEIGGVPAFWEDRLYGAEEGVSVPFAIGDVPLRGTNACQRCAVPARDVETGEKTPKNFTKQFVAQREASLPSWAHRSRFDHFYRVAVNTNPGGIRKGARLRVGDPLVIS